MTDPVVLWCEALRSGEYRQGRRRLTTRTPTGDLDCCLGVLCKVAIKAGVPVTVEHPGERGVLYDGAITYLPKSVQEWVGLHTGSGEYDDHASLADDNDDRGLSFREIADLIESRPPGLFKEPA